MADTIIKKIKDALQDSPSGVSGPKTAGFMESLNKKGEIINEAQNIIHQDHLVDGLSDFEEEFEPPTDPNLTVNPGHLEPESVPVSKKKRAKFPLGLPVDEYKTSYQYSGAQKVPTKLSSSLHGSMENLNNQAPSGNGEENSDSPKSRPQTPENPLDHGLTRESLLKPPIRYLARLEDVLDTEGFGEEALMGLADWEDYMGDMSLRSARMVRSMFANSPDPERTILESLDYLEVMRVQDDYLRLELIKTTADSLQETTANLKDHASMFIQQMSNAADRYTSMQEQMSETSRIIKSFNIDAARDPEPLYSENSKVVVPKAREVIIDGKQAMFSIQKGAINVRLIEWTFEEPEVQVLRLLKEDDDLKKLIKDGTDEELHAYITEAIEQHLSGEN